MTHLPLVSHAQSPVTRHSVPGFESQLKTLRKTLRAGLTQTLYAARRQTFAVRSLVRREPARAV
eukprot:12083695-Heterocapsa_arctica.AAC.1